MELGNTAYVILGMLGKGPKSGYEIKAKADISTRFFWAISYGQIYPELKRLEGAGLVAGEDAAEGGRRKRVYSITDAGRAALHEWLTRPGELHAELRHEGVLRFFFADSLDPDEARALIATIRARHERIRDELTAIEPGARAMRDDSGDPFPLLTLETGIGYQELFVELCDRLERRLAEETRQTTGED